MPYWYGDDVRCILKIVTGTSVWYHPGSKPAPIRWVSARLLARRCRLGRPRREFGFMLRQLPRVTLLGARLNLRARFPSSRLSRDWA